MAERYLNTNEIALREELKAEELNENTNKSTKFWLKVWQDWLWRENMMLILRIIQFCHANKKQLLSNFVKISKHNSTRTINP
jgi:hypothetical protein